jgi:hypothetical protein
MTRTLITYWMGTLIFVLVMGMSNAWADCQWDVSGTLEGEQAGLPGNPPAIWAIFGREVRLQVRWANMACPQVGFNPVECSWNTVGWSTDISNSQGDFTVQSVAFPDPVCQKDRDFRIEVRGYPITSWTVAAQVDSITGPNGFQGPQIPMAMHRVRLGTVRTDVYEAPSEVIWDEDRQPLLEPADNFPPNPGGDNPRNPQIEETPCGLETRSLGMSTEFRFGTMNASGNNVSFDRALMIETRANEAGRMTLNRITAHILVENAGQRGFSYSSHCPAKVTLRTNEGPGERSGDPWSAYEGDIPNVPATTEVPYERNGNLLGAGDDFADEPWDHDWEYALIEVVLDSGHDVMETAEGDNVVQHCYHAPSNSFSNMSNCSTKDGEGTGAVWDPVK